MLEVKRAELRLTFDRISQLRVEPAQHYADRSDPVERESQGDLAPVLTGERNPPVDEASTVVSKETLRQARAQFEFLARECIQRGDVATQAMCELGAHTMQLALAAEERADASPIGQMALSILSLSDPATPASGESERSVS